MFRHYGQKMLDRSLKNGTNPQFIGNLIDPVYSYKDLAGTFFLLLGLILSVTPDCKGNMVKTYNPNVPAIARGGRWLFFQYRYF